MIVITNLANGRAARYAKVTATALIAAIGLSGCAGSFKDTDPRYTHSVTQQQELKHWENKYAANKTDRTAVVGYAKALVKTRQESRALSLLKDAHKQAPDDKELTSEYGRIALSAGENDLASQLLSKAGKKPDWKILSAKGVLAAREGNNKKAINYFKQALRKNPRQASVLNNMGLAYAVSGKYTQAEKYIKQALWDGRFTRQVRQNLALVYAMQGKVKEAETIALDPLPKRYANMSKKNIPAKHSLGKKPVPSDFETSVERTRK